MARKNLYREQSLNRVSSPEQLNDYLKVTKPAVWAVLIAVIVLLVGVMIWSSFAYIASSVSGTAKVQDGTMTVYFEDQTFAGRVQEGMSVTVGETASTIVGVGRDMEGNIFAQADTILDNGIYQAKVTYKLTQVFSLLFSSK
jgi:hypothetical protein